MYFFCRIVSTKYAHFYYGLYNSVKEEMSVSTVYG